MRRSGATTLEVRVDGVVKSQTVTSTNVDIAGVPVDVFRRYPLVSSMTGAIAEMVAVRGSVADADLTSLEGYLKSKYGL